MTFFKKQLSKHPILWISIVLVMSMIVLVAVRTGEVHNIAKLELAPWALNSVRVTRGTVNSGFPVLATVSTKGEITLTAQISGTILDMGPREGVAVKTGDFLVRFDTRELAENIAGLQAKLEAARAEFSRQNDELKREEELFQHGGSSKTALEARRTATVAAQKNASSLERQIQSLIVRKEYGLVKAPANGVIAARMREPGDVCMPGQPIYRMTVSAGARVRVNLPQSVLVRVDPGSILELYHGNDTVRVELNRIYPSVDALALGAAEADLSTTPFNLPSGARITGRVILDEQTDALRVPPDAVLTGEADQQSKLFTIIKSDDGYHLHVIPVQVSLTGRCDVAVTGDLSEGDRVIVAHESVLMQLRDGDQVTVDEGGIS